MSEIVTVALDRIRLNTYNPNSMDAETFNALLKDMKEGGLEDIDPILLRPLEEATGADAEAVAEMEIAYEMVDGEHRTRAALRLGWIDIRARVREMSLEEAMVVNYRKNRERGRLDPIKEGKLYKWWSDERGLTMRQIGVKFDITHATVVSRIGNVENVEAEAIQVLRGQKPSTDDDGKALYHQSDVTEKGDETKNPTPRGSTREEPLEPTKLSLLGSINLEKLMKRARVLTGLKEHIPEDVCLMEELQEKYAEKVRSLQVEVAEEIREMSLRKAESYVEAVWGELLVEASKERRVRELRVIKAKLEKSGKTVILPEEKNWTHRDRLTDKGKVLDKCLYRCPQPTVLITKQVKTVEICGYGACWAETREELRAEQTRQGEEAARLLMEAREKIISAGEAGDRFWFRLLLFAMSLNRDTRPGYLDKYNLSNRWKPIVGMTDGQVLGCVLTLIADNLCRPRREGDEVDFLQVLNAICKQYGIERDYLLWKPEELVDVELEAAP